MQVTLKDNYVENWSVDGNIENSVMVEMPDNFEDFFKYYFCYKVKDGTLTKDTEKVDEYVHTAYIESLRERRSQECFPIINRGKLWYSRLTSEQYEELNIWYQNWLNVTDTLVAPNTPSWL